MIQIKIISSYTYIHSSETHFANASTSVLRKQNCPITSPYRRCVSFIYANIFEHAHATRLYGGGLLLPDCTRSLYQTTRRRPWGAARFEFLSWGSRYQTIRWLLLQECTRVLYQTTRRRPGGFKSCVGGNRGLLPHSLTTRLHEERRNKLRCLLPLCFILYKHAILL